MVVGTMLAAGIFTVPSSFAAATGPLGLVIVLAIAGYGTLMLAFCFQNLAERRPDLDAGIFAYAQAGFGDYAGFLAALAYWLGACLLNVIYFVLVKSAFGAVVPAFGDGNTPQAIFTASLVLWLIHFLILRGTKQAALVNAAVTVAKVGALVAAILVLAYGFSWETFKSNFWGGGTTDWRAVPGQVRDALLVAVYVFLGIEGASVYSRYAKNRADVGRATFWGLGLVAVMFLLVTALAYGVMPRWELADLRTPSLPRILEAVVGRWGAVFVSTALVVALTGAFLARSLLSAEALSAAARAGVVPRIFARENARRVPAPALWLSSATVQAFLLLSLHAEEAYVRWFELTSAMILVPYLLVGAFAAQLAWRGETYDGEARQRQRDLRRGLAATAYAVLLLWAAGWTFVLVFALIFALGSGLYVKARWERRVRVFAPAEAVLCSLWAVGGVLCLWLLAVGVLRI